MTTFPGSPRLLKGALITIGALNVPASAIIFQYNPETMSRQVQARTVSGGGGQEGGSRGEALRLSGPPQETITLSVEIDATDQLEQTNPIAIASGVYPTLSALEMLLYPSRERVLSNFSLAQSGNIEVIPPESSLTLFVWGPSRVVPVRLTSFTINEEAYDTLLNPIRAKADLSLDVLSYYDLKPDNIGHNIFLVHQTVKEVLATANLFNSLQEVGASVKLF